MRRHSTNPKSGLQFASSQARTSARTGIFADLADEAYKAAVKKRFVQWVSDLCRRERGQAWLDYQEEIGLRHTPTKKNKTEEAQTPDVVPLRYVWAFAGPVISGAREFLASKSHSAAEVERMHRAWAKSVLLTLTLWARPYVKDGLW